jgi:hypothetical protein
MLMLLEIRAWSLSLLPQALYVHLNGTQQNYHLSPIFFTVEDYKAESEQWPLWQPPSYQSVIRTEVCWEACRPLCRCVRRICHLGEELKKFMKNKHWWTLTVTILSHCVDLSTLQDTYDVKTAGESDSHAVFTNYNFTIKSGGLR